MTRVNNNVAIAFLLGASCMLTVTLFYQAANHVSLHPRQSTELESDLLAIKELLYNLTLIHERPEATQTVKPHALSPPTLSVHVHHVGQAGNACHASGSRRMTVPLHKELVAPVVVVAHNRVHYLAKAVTNLLRYWLQDPKHANMFPLYVSVDGHDSHTLAFATALEHAGRVQVIQNLRQTKLCNHGYCHLSQHYKMLLQLFFECHKAPRLLFLEEDLLIAPDFFSYFEAGAQLLAQDKSLWCISAWNDHGQAGRAANLTALYRTDVMPGLGWMLQADVGRELWSQWPKQYWDDWMRQPEVRQGRQCVFPEASRTHTYGKAGTSGGMLYRDHLANMLLSNATLVWTDMNFNYLIKNTYHELILHWVKHATATPENLAEYCGSSLADVPNKHDDLRVHYTGKDGFMQTAKALAPMLADWRSDSPRMGYHGIVMVRCRGRRLFLVPHNFTAA